MQSNAAAAPMTSDIFLTVDGMNTNAIWSRVNQELNAGRRVWLAGQLVEPFAQSLGHSHQGRNWILVTCQGTQHEWTYRLRDILVSAVALVLLAPVYGILALLVKLSSPGPILYSTSVVGKAKRHFIWRKFRSMVAHDRVEDEAARADRFRVFAEQKHKGKVIDDHRVTRIGHFMRKHSLDELPQLWNVFIGEMTLVGPRPCLPYEAEIFPSWARKRFQVQPGLTGLWQVAGRGRTTLEEGLMMDVYYVFARSFGLDTRLVIKTLGVVFFGEGGR
jgi:lipopolysaccharide/colanic/teichoic acid biosynthesis glycosyltransferase